MKCLLRKEHNPRCIGEKVLEVQDQVDQVGGYIGTLHRMYQKASRQKSEVLRKANGDILK
jgi:hypothetical protein